MQFDSISAFWAMGGYGFYVWLSYGFGALVLIALYIASLYKTAAIKKQIKQKHKREQKLKQAALAAKNEQVQAQSLEKNTEVPS